MTSDSNVHARDTIYVDTTTSIHNQIESDFIINFVFKGLTDIAVLNNIT